MTRRRPETCTAHKKPKGKSKGKSSSPESGGKTFAESPLKGTKSKGKGKTKGEGGKYHFKGTIK